MTTCSVTVRMYDVGFGDAFLITARRKDQEWRMLVDCGVHSHGKDRPLIDVVKTIIANLDEASEQGTPPTLDVIVATHHHADHIAGFAYDDWEKVQVGEVWVPFVENDADEDTKKLKNGLAYAAQSLNALIDRAPFSDAGKRTEKLELAGALAANSLRNENALDRLLGRNGKHFLNSPKIRYLPDKIPLLNVIRTSLPNVNVHVLGPSRDPDQLRQMDPPKSARWLAMQHALESETKSEPAGEETRTKPIFQEVYRLGPEEIDDSDLIGALPTLNLSTLFEDADDLLAAASILERSVNNTSLFFVLDADGTRLVFVGDSQRGAWDHILQDNAARNLVSAPAFYKIGHHGSHNATPKEYVTEVIGDQETYAMLPYGKVDQWHHIPKSELLLKLKETNTRVIRSDDPPIDDARVKVGPGNMWSEITFTST